MLKRKLSTAAGVFKGQGLAGILSVFTGKKDAVSRDIQKWWNRNDHWLVGKWVEWSGNRVKMGGCEFDVDSPFISTRLKSRFLLDRYEKPEREALADLDPALPVIELGAGIGVVSCLANKKLAVPEKHVVVEANPYILPLLYKNREHNQCQFSIVHSAIGYGGVTLSFYIQPEFIESNAFSPQGTRITLATTSVEKIANDFKFDRCSLICDIEGTEVDLVLREADFLRRRVDFVVFEVHEDKVGKEPVADMLSRLQEMGFVIRWLTRKTFAAKKLGAGGASS